MNIAPNIQFTKEQLDVFAKAARDVVRKNEQVSNYLTALWQTKVTEAQNAPPAESALRMCEARTISSIYSALFDESKAEAIKKF